MTEKEKMLLGMIYDANNDSALIAERMACKEQTKRTRQAAEKPADR